MTTSNDTLDAGLRPSIAANGTDHGGRMRFAFLAETLPYSLDRDPGGEGATPLEALRERRARRRAGGP